MWGEIIFSLFAISPDGSVGIVRELEKIHPDLNIFRKRPRRLISAGSL